MAGEEIRSFGTDTMAGRASLKETELLQEVEMPIGLSLVKKLLHAPHIGSVAARTPPLN